jgi:diguanylate cyclase (GGDEF)-like protein
VVGLTLAIAVLNVCLGYGLAVYLGYGPPGVFEAWDALVYDVMSRSERAGESDSKSLLDMLDGGSEEAEIDPFDESYDDDVADVIRLLSPDNPESWDLNEKYVETSILRLNIAMMKSGKRSTEIDTRLRECGGQTDAETVRSCLALLQEDCETYLAEQSDASERFRERVGELGELASLGEEIEMANLEQAAQIETTLNNLRYMDFDSDLEAANERLRLEIAKLRIARHNLRDSQDVAFLTIARYENRLDNIEKQLSNDPLTGLRNRIGLEMTLADWWQQGRHKTRRMAAALFDIDEFGLLNERHGPLVCDRLLHALGRFFQEKAGAGNLVGRFAGQRFLVAMVDTGPRAATRNAELLRQTIEKIEFLSGETQVRLTVGAGVVEVKVEDTYEQVFERLQAALKAAKKAGPNRAALYERREPELVDPPDLGAEPATIAL